MIALLLAVALVNATVHTGDGPPLENATVLIAGERISAVGIRVQLSMDTEVIDLSGMHITPGLIDASSRLGVAEVSAEASAVEGTAGPDHDPVRAALRIEDSFNPESFVIPVARQGGITSAVVRPTGGLIAGTSVWVDLVDDEPVRREGLALHISLEASRKPRGGRSRAFLRLREVFEDARLFRANRGPYISGKLRDLTVSSRDLAVLGRALDRDLPVVFEVDRAADIRTVLRIAEEHRLDAILSGVTEGWLVADLIAKANIPVLVDPLENLPESFDQLQSRDDNSGLLHKAGVKVAFALRGGAHRAHRLRYVAGNAVGHGFSHHEALTAITRTPAEIFRMTDAGVIKEGALANLAVWNGDPLEPVRWAEQLYIRGRRVPLRSRQDLLTERYLQDSTHH